MSGGAAAAVPVRATPRFPCFDGLRCLAAMGILVFHVASSTGTTTSRFWGHYFARLDVGVAVFFVVSGFLLYRPFVAAHLASRPPSRWRDFWWRRALRIYPAYWVVLTAAIVLFRSTHFVGFGDYVRYYALVQIYAAPNGLRGIIPTWSLAVEVSFYAALPFYAWALGRAGAGRPRPRAFLIEMAGAALLYGAGLGVRAYLFYRTGPGTPSAQWLPAQLDLFALGITLAVLSAAASEGLTAAIVDPVARTVAWLGDHALVSWLLAVAAFATVCNIGLPTNFAVATFQRKEEMAHQVLYGLTAFFLVLPAVFGPQDRSLVRRLLRHRVAAAIGVVSYGVFLWHFDWINQLIDFGLLRHVHTLQFPVLLLATVVLTVATAMASWHLVERPTLALKDRVPWHGDSRPRSEGLAR